MRPDFEISSENPIFLAWTAAWLEAEGSIRLAHRRNTSFQVSISIWQKKPAPLRIIYTGCPFGVLKPQRSGKIWILRYVSNRAIQFLMPLIPYLICKYDQAKLVIRAQEIITKRYNRWHPRPQEEVDELWNIKNRIHEITGVSSETRAKQSIAGKANRLPEGQWALKHDKCLICGTIETRHQALGRCTRCYQRIRQREYRTANRKPKRWAKRHDKCLNCGTTERSHQAKGFCNNCYRNMWQRNKRHNVTSVN